MNYEIIVPRLDWLKGGEANEWDGNFNVYYASVGTDALKGCLTQKIFNYRVWIERIEGTITIFSSVYSGMLSYDNTSEEQKQNASFDFTEDGREKMKLWIEEKAKEYYER